MRMRTASAWAIACLAMMGSAAADEHQEHAEEPIKTTETVEQVDGDISTEDDANTVEEDRRSETEGGGGGPLANSRARIDKRQDEQLEARKRLKAYGDQRSRWRFGTALAFGNAEVDINNVEVDVPDDFNIEDLEVRVTELSEISSTAFVASAGYRVLPFLEVFGQMGVLQSETVTAFELTGTPNFGIFDIDEPITLNLDRGDEASGYTFGVGTKAIAPLGFVAGRPLIAVTGFRYNWNRVDGGDITSEALQLQGGFAYAVPTENALYSFTAGAGYARLEREATREASFAGEDLKIRVEQELENPWSVDLGVTRSLGDNWTIGYGLSANMSGPMSHGIALSFSPNKM